MKNSAELFEFICQLIDIQIQKYVGLASFGVGPDARLNANLVLDETNELFQLANNLLTQLKSDKKSNTEEFEILFNQVRFYIEQEYLRGHAGWLISENNIHTPELKRVSEQKNQLYKIAKSLNINVSQPAKAQTHLQKQCEYDSHAIAYYILDLAVNLINNPTIELDNKIPLHAQMILRANATLNGRYYKKDILESILKLYNQCKKFMDNNTSLTKSTSQLSKQEAQIQSTEHTAHLQSLLKSYQDIKPTADIFSSQHKWYKIGNMPSSVARSTSYLQKLKLFGYSAILATPFVYLLISYLQGQEKTAMPSNGLK